jgi:hypothetical protein
MDAIGAIAVLILFLLRGRKAMEKKPLEQTTEENHATHPLQTDNSVAVPADIARFVRTGYGIDNTPPNDLIPNIRLTALRFSYVEDWAKKNGFNITLTSGYRNEMLNKAVGGVPNEDHSLGLAVDFVTGSDPTDFVKKFAPVIRQGTLDNVFQIIAEHAHAHVHLSWKKPGVVYTNPQFLIGDKNGKYTVVEGV